MKAPRIAGCCSEARVRMVVMLVFGMGLSIVFCYVGFMSVLRLWFERVN
jgi:hypothetical protein